MQAVLAYGNPAISYSKVNTSFKIGGGTPVDSLSDSLSKAKNPKLTPISANKNDSTKDSDSDGLTNDLELVLGTDPSETSSSEDGTDDYTRIMVQRDIPSHKKKSKIVDAPSNASPASSAISKSSAYLVSNPPIDSDNDGLNDIIETGGPLGYKTDPNKADTDNDGLNDLEEYWWQCDPTNPDTNGDGVRDGPSVDYANPSRIYPYNGSLNNIVDIDGDGLPTAAEKNDPRLGTNFKEYSTDGDPYGDGQEYFDVGIPKISPADHPLVAAYPNLKVMLSRIQYVTTGEITSTRGSSTQSAWSSEKTDSKTTSFNNIEEWGWGVVMGTDVGIEEFLPKCSAKYEFDLHYTDVDEKGTEYYHSDTKSSSGFTQGDWSTANTLDKERAALISLIFNVKNIGTLPAQGITPYVNLKLGEQEIATIGSLTEVTSLPAGSTSKNLVVREDESGGEIALSLDQLKSIECSSPLTIETFQIDATAKKWDENRKEWVLLDQDFSAYMDEINKKTATLLLGLDDGSWKEYKVAEGLTLGDAFNLTIGRDNSITALTISRYDLGFPMDARIAIMELIENNESILDLPLEQGWTISVCPLEEDLRIGWASYDEESKTVSASVISRNKIENVWAHVKTGDRYENLTLVSPYNNNIYTNKSGGEIELDDNCYVMATDIGKKSIKSKLSVTLRPRVFQFKDGRYLIIAKRSEKAMECSGEQYGYNVYQSDCFGCSPQIWILNPIEKGIYSIRNEKYNNHYLEVDESKLNAGANVQGGIYEGKPSQQWSFVPDGKGSYAILALHSGRCLTVDGNKMDNSVSVIQDDYQQKLNQMWIVQPVDSYPFNLSSDCSHLLKEISFGIMPASSGISYLEYYDNKVMKSQYCTLWKLQPIGDGFFALMNSTKCLQAEILDLDNESRGFKVTVGEYKGLDNQMWRFKPICDNQYEIRVKNSNKCLEIDGNKMAVLKRDYCGYLNQRFFVNDLCTINIEGNDRTGIHQLPSIIFRPIANTGKTSAV